VTRFVNVDLQPRYNVAPSQAVETIIRVDSGKRLGPMRWGFVSPSAKDPKLAPINARAETLATSSMFKDAFRRHRCLVVADGFYEWRKDSLRRTDVGTRAACALLSCPPNELMATIHNRMP
jgi:putative SOS response-associated peptidase YedK